jgi:hypothetical protein
MSTADNNSSLGFSFDPNTASTGGRQPIAAEAGIWLDGEVLACACPDCAAPMSIRLWLLVADCWRCGASIELTAEQERVAHRLLRKREAAGQPEHRKAKEKPAAPLAVEVATAVRQSTPADKSTATAPNKSALTAPKQRKPAFERNSLLNKSGATAGLSSSAMNPAGNTAGQGSSGTDSSQERHLQRAGKPQPAPERTAAAAKPVGVRAQLQEISKFGEARVWLGNWLRALPAWLTSLILHMVLIILLGLWLIQDTPRPPRITLATRISDDDEPGAEPADDEPVDAFEFDDPGELDSEDVTQDDPFEMTSLDPFEVTAPEQTAGSDELLADAVQAPALGPLEPGNIFAGRDPRLRKQLLEREGGTDYTEAAVARGLKWLARHQNADGSWSLHAFHQAGDCDGQCKDRGQPSDTAATALALLPFLGAGETHRAGVYADTVARGLYWLVDHQKPGGDLRGGGIGRMYAHGQCAIVLCEAYALSRDEELREPAQKAIDFIVNAQHKQGGWRYSPGQPGDTSVVGWQLMALRSAQMAYLNVPERTLDLSGRFLDRVQTDSPGGRYGYMPGHGSSATMTAEALLCRQYAGWPRGHAGMRAGVEYLLARHLPSRNQPNIYYWYYATQVMHHYGGQEWETWNYALRDILVETQKTRGHEAGSWNLGDPYVSNGGRLYVTSLAICTLEVYYRHLPLYGAGAIDD